MKDEPLKLNGWEYFAQVDELDQLHINVTYPKRYKLPASLCKISSVSDWSIDALRNNYLYGAHPWSFNDLFDCHKDLVISDCDENREIILAFMKELYGSKLDGLTSEELEERIHESRNDIAYLTFGMICLTPKADNVLMWAYYGNNKGFLVEYDYKQFPSYVYGPFPINYQSEVQKISLKEHGNRVATVYQSLVKSKRWEHEDEWRFLCMSENSTHLIPFGVKEEDNNGSHNRKFSYPEEAILSISLGNRFFEIEEMHIKGKELLITFNKEDKRKELLDIIIERKIDVKIAMKQSDLMHINFKRCELEKDGELSYRFIGV